MKVERNQEGKVSINDDHVFSVPSDMSMLCAFQNGKLVKGMSFDDDFWIRLKGKKIRHWTSRVDGIRVWEPKLKNIPRLLEIYEYHHKKLKKYSSALNEAVVAIINAGGIAHAKPTHKYEPLHGVDEADTYWKYSVGESPYERGSWAFGFDWTEVKNKDDLINLELGNKLYKLQQSGKYICGTSLKITKVILHAVRRVGYQWEQPKTSDQVAILKYGDYYFLFLSQFNGSAGHRWELQNDCISSALKIIEGT
jgi:hypothetical protein